MPIRTLAAACVLFLSACGVGGVGSSTAPAPGTSHPQTFEGPVAKAACQDGDLVETGIQGQVPQSDRAGPRATMGYNCNLKAKGAFDNGGEGAGWQHAWYEDCAYMGTATGTANQTVNGQKQRVPKPGQLHPGVAVIDVSDSTKPVATTYLTSISMSDPWESLKVNERRELLADVNAATGGSNGGPEIDIYDLSGGCRQPALLASVAIGTSNGHAGHFAPDGMTYYGSPIQAGVIKAVDISDPTHPALLKESFLLGTHDLSISQDGNRAFLANNNGNTGKGNNGLSILDVSEVQSRKPNPADTIVSEVYWDDGSTAQMTQRITVRGKPYILFVDEGGKGAARLIDISDEANPFIASKLKLDVHMPENASTIQNDVGSVVFGYEGHYCTASDGVHDNTTYDVENAVLVACGYFESGLRVFDIRDVYHPKEIAYYIPPTSPGYHAGSYYNLNGTCSSAVWASSHPRVVPAKNEIWFTEQCSGFHVVEFEKPLAELLGAAPP